MFQFMDYYNSTEDDQIFFEDFNTGKLNDLIQKHFVNSVQVAKQ